MVPDRQPVLAGALVLLRPTVPADHDALYAVARDPALWALHPAHDRWQAPRFRALFDDGLASGGALTIRDAANGAVIGMSRYDNWRPEADRIEIGWTFLARERWGGAVNAEVKALMIAHIRRFVSEIVFVVGEHNLRSRRALEKIGAYDTGEREVRAMAGLDVVHHVYALGRA